MTLAVCFSRDPGDKVLRDAGIEMENTKIVPPAIEAVGVPLAESRKTTLAGTQMEKHGRTHCGPAQAGTCPHRLVDIGDAGDTGLHEMDRLAPDRRLQAVGD